MKKAVFFDIDGTLIDAPHGKPDISPASRTAIKKLQREGHYVFIASGRPFGFINSTIVDVGFDGFVQMNGAVVTVHDEIVYEKAIPFATVKELRRIAAEAGADYDLQTPNYIYIQPTFTRLINFYRSIHVPEAYWRHDFDPEEIREVYKMEFTSQSDLFDQSLFDQFISLPNMTGVSDPNHGANIEIYSKLETKGSGIRHALDYLGIPIENSYAFSDGINDIEMMQTVGHSLVMGNAVKELLPLAETVLPTVAEEGVAWGIEHCVL
ncbi:Cof-type HAD-IIB family hydrolase [Selenomonas sp. TAMA-11512]|uniref:HAD family hydrolase n=1 Tax=Selenomonas sp. TAMA-11512 TaxID=3095337 RepID=UPI00308CAC9C|nr:Cof-type HAD-IIB family hydrolase [Selenomonas sp. TAMA-11512]